MVLLHPIVVVCTELWKDCSELHQSGIVNKNTSKNCGGLAQILANSAFCGSYQVQNMVLTVQYN